MPSSSSYKPPQQQMMCDTPAAPPSCGQGQTGKAQRTGAPGGRRGRFGRQAGGGLGPAAAGQGKVATYPTGYPMPSAGLDHLWGYEASLCYSPEWEQRTGFRAHLLRCLEGTQDYPGKQDAAFVHALYGRAPLPGYRLAASYLLSDPSAEQSFVAGLDLLEKKHGNVAHNPRWKRADADQPTIWAARKQSRAQLKEHRYRSVHIPHVKLLAGWHSVEPGTLQQLGQEGFNRIPFVPDGELGKGYYGFSSPAHALPGGPLDHSGPLWMLVSWYAGKVILPTFVGDPLELKGQPHYANYDLHYQGEGANYTAVVFDGAQLLPRYLVLLEPSELGSTPSTEPSGEATTSPFEGLTALQDERSAIFQTDLSYLRQGLADEARSRIASHLPSFISAHTGQSNAKPASTQAIEAFGAPSVSLKDHLYAWLQDPSQEVLLLATATDDDSVLIAHYLEH